MSEKPLNAQQQLFAEEYLVDFNAGAAYERAGYKASGKARDAAASRLLANPALQAYLATRKKALLQQTQTDQEAVLKRLVGLALGDRRQLFTPENGLKDMHELSADQAALIAGIEILEVYEGRGDDRRFVGLTKKVKLVNPLDSVRTLGQHYGMFTKKVEHTHKVPGMNEILDEIEGEGADTGPGRSRSRGG